jgi:hypothetical protein
MSGKNDEIGDLEDGADLVEGLFFASIVAIGLMLAVRLLI